MLGLLKGFRESFLVGFWSLFLMYLASTNGHVDSSKQVEVVVRPRHAYKTTGFCFCFDRIL